MKTKIVAFLLLFQATSFATVPHYPNFSGGLLPNVEVFFASWCQEGAVVFNPELREPKAPIRCASYGKACVQEERIIHQYLINISAVCK